MGPAERAPGQPMSAGLPPLPAVLVVDALGVGELYADTLRTHGAAERVEIAAPTDNLGSTAGHADMAICTPGATPTELFSCVTAVRSANGKLPILFLAPPEVPDAVGGALQAGATDVLNKSPGYIDQLPLAVRKNVLLARRAGAQAGQLRLLARTVQEIREDNRALQGLVEKLQAVAMTDPLTHLPNRRAIEQRLEELAATSGRHEHDLSLLMIDLDGLKLVNDVLGHQAGDELLRSAANGLRSLCRKGDVPGRLGGDEFVVLLPHTRIDRAAEVARRIQGAFASQTAELQRRLDAARRALRGDVISKIGSDGRLQRGKLGMTIGVAGSTPASRVEPKTLLLQADKALYAGKREARGSVRVADGAVVIPRKLTA